MAERKPPMRRLAPNTIAASALDTMRKKARNATKPEVLEEIYNNYCYDELVCQNLSKNSAINTTLREKLAKHKNPLIRLEIARWSQFIEDEKTLKNLALDCYEIRKEVARSTESESVKELLYRMNPQHIDIQMMCLKRLKNQNVVEKLIFGKKSKNIAQKFLNNLLENPDLNYRIILLFFKHAEILRDAQIDLICKLVEEHRKSAEEMLDKILPKNKI